MESFRERRAKASVLLSYVGEAGPSKASEALHIYRTWLEGRITYREALAKLRKLANGKG